MNQVKAKKKVKVVKNQVIVRKNERKRRRKVRKAERTETQMNEIIIIN